MSTVIVDDHGPVRVVTLNRPEVRNAVDAATAESLFEEFERFDSETAVSVAILTGTGKDFCAGADLSEIASGRELTDARGPMGPTRMQLSKPVIAAVEGHAVAGGLELALWCDLRVASHSAVFGVFNRRFGVPLIDLGTVRLPRLLGQGRALDMILTGRGVGAEEALAMGLVNRLTDDGEALSAALELAKEISAFPQVAMRNDRLSALEQWGLGWEEAVAHEWRKGMDTIERDDPSLGARAFVEGEGRHGAPRD